MITTITLNGGRPLELAANAATPYRFKQIFKKDLFQLFTSAAIKGEESGIDIADSLPELAYIMNMQANKKDMNSLSYDDFMEWLEGFGPMDLIYAGEDIMNFYLQSTASSVSPKKV